MRYQFYVRAYPKGNFDLEQARAVCIKLGAKHVRIAYPMVLRGNEGIAKGGPNAKYWRGTNQAKTVAFSVADNDQAKAIKLAYNDDIAFVWNLTEGHYV